VKKFVLLVLILAAALEIMAQYKAIDSKSAVTFKIKNFGINVDGKFGGLDGDISFDPNKPEEATFKVSIDAGTVNTENDLRDSHLKKESYFDAEHFPRIQFKSTKIGHSSKKGLFLIYGDLNIKNHSKEISFPFTAEPSGDGYLFKGVFSINRRDFDVGGASIISDNAEISLNVYAHK
jgi:polyisoprenoid-binding protein YceI